MKKLLGIVVLGLLLSGNDSAASGWIEIKSKNNQSKHWNVKKAEEIAPNTFKVPSVIIKTEEKLKYENFLIKNMVPYCGKAPGKYKEPSSFLIHGKPTTLKRSIQFLPGVEEGLWNDYKAGKSKKPPGMSLEEFQFEWYGNYIDASQKTVLYEIPYEKFNSIGKFSFTVWCSSRISNNVIFDYSKSNENAVIAENIKFHSQETVKPDFFNCRKRTMGIEVFGEVIWDPRPVRKNTHGELYLNTLCEKLNR
tara:strand:- start:212 stop:961 length:750 start_codon:yes stop_codon:yes gene_type:complete